MTAVALGTSIALRDCGFEILKVKFPFAMDPESLVFCPTTFFHKVAPFLTVIKSSQTCKGVENLTNTGFKMEFKMVTPRSIQAVATTAAAATTLRLLPA